MFLSSNFIQINGLLLARFKFFFYIQLGAQNDAIQRPILCFVVFQVIAFFLLSFSAFALRLAVMTYNKEMNNNVMQTMAAFNIICISSIFYCILFIFYQDGLNFHVNESMTSESQWRGLLTSCLII